MAPVGLEVATEEDPSEELLGQPPTDRAQQTGPIRLPLRRRRLGGIVLGTLGGCALILVAAVIARVSHASSEPAAAAAPAKTAPAAAVASPPPPPERTVPGGTLPSQEAPATGTLRLERPALPGRVWIDGKKQLSASLILACGAHQIKVGPRGRARTVDVPCGGEIVVSK
jgi:hypothetical protein